jgi:hypothetical protein
MQQMRQTVRQLAQLFPTGIISGRGREKVENFVQLSELYYAGSHGMDIAGPQVCLLAHVCMYCMHMQASGVHAGVRVCMCMCMHAPACM